MRLFLQLAIIAGTSRGSGALDFVGAPSVGALFSYSYASDEGLADNDDSGHSEEHSDPSPSPPAKPLVARSYPTSAPSPAPLKLSYPKGNGLALGLGVYIVESIILFIGWRCWVNSRKVEEEYFRDDDRLFSRDMP